MPTTSIVDALAERRLFQPHFPAATWSPWFACLRAAYGRPLEDLRRAGKKASDYRGPKQNVVKGNFERTVPEPSQDNVNSSPLAVAAVEVAEC
jgi:hypothetical protein